MKGILHVGVCSAMGTRGVKEEVSSANSGQIWQKGARVVPAIPETNKGGKGGEGGDAKVLGASTVSEPEDSKLPCKTSDHLLDLSYLSYAENENSSILKAFPADLMRYMSSYDELQVNLYWADIRRNMEERIEEHWAMGGVNWMDENGVRM